MPEKKSPQIEFEFEPKKKPQVDSSKKEELKKKSLADEFELDEIDCQYSEDIGPCVYCERGKQFTRDNKLKWPSSGK